MDVPVLLPKIFNYPLTYESGNIKSIETGDIVEVPFGNKIEIGVVWNKAQKTKKEFKIKAIKKKINNISISKNLVEFINWFSSYNLVSKGLVLKMCIGNEKKFFAKKKYPVKKNIPKIKNKYKLSNEQNKALSDLNKFGNKFHVSVLQGVTGSGKTIVYFEKIKKILGQNKQVLIMLPEIFLTSQFKERFINFFGFEPCIWHSRITPKNKRIIWNGVIKNKIKLVIGARSSLLLPFSNLGLIIIDEEHDASYKQEEGLIYNARDMGIVRASFENIPIYLVTSIPSLETFHNIKKKKYNLTIIKKRYKNFPFPKSKIINLNLRKIKNNFIADETSKIVNEYLTRNNQVLFFLNRRGYSPFLICENCGFKHTCPNCSIYLTYHKYSEKIFCHHCGHHSNKKRVCKDKKKNCNFKMFGPGVEKIYEEVKKKFPEKKIKIISSDYFKNKKENIETLNEIENNKINILVGTQMISKGFNFPKLNCIVVVDADFSGRGFDLRSTEKNIQLYNQLSGRAGRFDSNSQIIYQTITPTHETLQDLVKNDPIQFLENELKIRKKNNLPPFKKLISIIISAKIKENSFQGAQEIKNKLAQKTNLEILGPVESPLAKIRKNFRTRLLIKTDHRKQDKILLEKSLDSLKISSKIKLTVDVDPINFV